MKANNKSKLTPEELEDLAAEDAQAKDELVSLENSNPTKQAIVAAQMKVSRRIMRENAEVLRRLADS